MNLQILTGGENFLKFLVLSFSEFKANLLDLGTFMSLGPW